jgi:hypothetical protein
LTLDAYIISALGGVRVLCSPSDNGKTHAAEFSMHGDDLFCPDKSLKVSATFMKNFSEEYATKALGGVAVAFLSELVLCGALSVDVETGTKSYKNAKLISR